MPEAAPPFRSAMRINTLSTQQRSCTTAEGTRKVRKLSPLWKGAWKVISYLNLNVDNISQKNIFMQVFLANFGSGLSKTCVQDDSILVGS